MGRLGTPPAPSSSTSSPSLPTVVPPSISAPSAALELLRAAEAAAPHRGQEPWRYTDLRALFSPDQDAVVALGGDELIAIDDLLEDVDPSASGAKSATPAALRLVFVDGAFDAQRSVLRPPTSPGASTSPASSSATKASFAVGTASQLRAQSRELEARIDMLLSAVPEKDDFFPVSTPNDALGCQTLASLNQAMYKDCACVLCPDTEGGSAGGEEDDDEELLVHVAFVSTPAASNGGVAVAPRLVIDAGRRRRLRVVESHLSAGGSDASFSNGVCRVVLAEGAKVAHEVLQQKGDAARFVESLTAEVGDGAEYRLRLVQSGASVARVNAAVALQGPKSSCEVLGVSLANQRQQLGFHSLIHHSVPGCKSEQQQKHLVAGEAECIFKGSIRVDKEAQKTDSSQLCRSLLLSRRAKVKAMPCLQIQADDVSCSHGAAISELDKAEVFYLESRGLSPPSARRLLAEAFPQDLLAGLGGLAPKALRRLTAKLGRLVEAPEKTLVA